MSGISNFFTQMLWVDWIFLLILLFSIILATKRGFVRELLTLIGLVIAFYVGFKFSTNVSTIINKLFGKDLVSASMTITAIFFITFVSFTKISVRALKKLTGGRVATFDRFIGFIFGFVRGVFISVLIIAVGVFSTLFADDQWKQSPIVKLLQPLTNKLLYLVPDNIENIAKEQVQILDQLDSVQDIKKAVNKSFKANLKVNNNPKPPVNTNQSTDVAPNPNLQPTSAVQNTNLNSQPTNLAPNTTPNTNTTQQPVVNQTQPIQPIEPPKPRILEQNNGRNNSQRELLLKIQKEQEIERLKQQQLLQQKQIQQIQQIQKQQ